MIQKQNSIYNTLDAYITVQIRMHCIHNKIMHTIIELLCLFVTKVQTTTINSNTYSHFTFLFCCCYCCYSMDNGHYVNIAQNTVHSSHTQFNSSLMIFIVCNKLVWNIYCKTTKYIAINIVNKLFPIENSEKQISTKALLLFIYDRFSVAFFSPVFVAHISSSRHCCFDMFVRHG